MQYLGVTVRVWCVQWGLLGCDVFLFHKHEKLYVVEQGHLCCYVMGH